MNEDYKEEDYREVYFHEYCPKCKYEKLTENEKPCRHCLAEPINLWTNKPVKFESK